MGRSADQNQEVGKPVPRHRTRPQRTKEEWITVLVQRNYWFLRCRLRKAKVESSVFRLAWTAFTLLGLPCVQPFLDAHRVHLAHPAQEKVDSHSDHVFKWDTPPVDQMLL